MSAWNFRARIGGPADPVVVQPTQHVGEGLERIAVEADHEQRDDLDAAGAQPGEVLLEAARTVELFWRPTPGSPPTGSRSRWRGRAPPSVPPGRAARGRARR